MIFLTKVNSYQNQFTRESLTIEYVNCLMALTKNFPDQLFPGKRCAQEFHLENWEVIEACANTTEGSKLLQKNGELTEALKPSLTSVPTITFRYVSISRSQKPYKLLKRNSLTATRRNTSPSSCELPFSRL